MLYKNGIQNSTILDLINEICTNKTFKPVKSETEQIITKIKSIFNQELFEDYNKLINLNDDKCLKNIKRY